MTNKLSTESYKGVRDFYPEDTAIQHYIFNTWSQTAEKFGFERYDASILEPAILYKNKGVENTEIINEQSYTFIDRGEREVTLRPEMTPTLARMVSGKYRELKFPLRWYSIPNLFRYERPQRGRLREHWQLNCDILGTDNYLADVEVIALAYQTLLDLGATPDMFEIRLNDRALMKRTYEAIGLNETQISEITKLNDRRRKIDIATYTKELNQITGDEVLTEEIVLLLDQSDEQSDVVIALRELGINNVVFDKSLARGFDYYTGTIFEFFDTSPDNNRALIGGGRYDHLTKMFNDEPISGVGFGIGDVTMRDFLETHNLLPKNITNTAPTLCIIPLEESLGLEAEKIALHFRRQNIKTTVDIGSKKVGKKIKDAVDCGIKYTIIIGTDEIDSGKFILKNLSASTEKEGSLEDLTKDLKLNS